MWAAVRHYSSKTLFLKPAKFDVKRIIRDIGLYKDSIARRELVGQEQLVGALDGQLAATYERTKDIHAKISAVQTERKALEFSIRQHKVHGDEVLKELRSLKSQFSALAEQLQEANSKIQDICLRLPNLIHESAPDTAPVIDRWINRGLYETFEQQENRDHVYIMTKCKQLLDLASASNISGNSWYYLINEGAQLETALVNYALDQAEKHGFQRCIPPSIARKEIIDACGFTPRDMNNEKQIYEIEDGNNKLGLTATAEITLAGMNANKILDLDENNPTKRLVGVSRSYRAEAGARGKDTKGLYRVHEFTKVELFCWSLPQHSEKVLEDLKEFQVKLISDLGLCAQVLNMPANDLGNPAYKKYDIEVWMPGRGKFGEVSSTSNCTDFQSRRLFTRYQNKESSKLEYVHTLNGTAMAVPRMILAIIENFYDPSTNMVTVPSPLIPYMNGKTKF